MSLQTRKIDQMYKVLQALTAVTMESHGGCSEDTQNLEHQMFVLEELMTPAIITVEMVLDLRNLTGEGMMACKKALTETKYDQEKAVEYLRRM